MRWLYGRFGRESARYSCSHFHPLPLLIRSPKSYPWMPNDDPLGNIASHPRTDHTCCTSHRGHTVAMRTGTCGLHRQSIGTSATMPIGPPFPIQRLLESRRLPFHTQGGHYPMLATQCKALAVASNRRSTATEQTLFRLLPPTLTADAAIFFSTAFWPFVAQSCHKAAAASSWGRKVFPGFHLLRPLQVQTRTLRQLLILFTPGSNTQCSPNTSSNLQVATASNLSAHPTCTQQHGNSTHSSTSLRTINKFVQPHISLSPTPHRLSGSNTVISNYCVVHNRQLCDSQPLLFEI